ncbi:hypothetical protein [aff. Roholtiella sp. LEGE 12411]|uniref:hypothetical protein n=1 Tax=aff. Roholtiella sp. LEGE 12411 TaxID=1828822 RepID=UPI001FC83A5C|nr:hypothetical protein [aff. Roholtiella sp. LEGE 12411]
MPALSKYINQFYERTVISANGELDSDKLALALKTIAAIAYTQEAAKLKTPKMNNCVAVFILLADY